MSWRRSYSLALTTFSIKSFSTSRYFCFKTVKKIYLETTRKKKYNFDIVDRHLMANNKQRFDIKSLYNNSAVNWLFL